jgi:hypothetical protein
MKKGSDSLYSGTVLSLPVVPFPMLGSMCHSTLNASYRDSHIHWVARVNIQ